MGYELAIGSSGEEVGRAKLGAGNQKIEYRNATEYTWTTKRSAAGRHRPWSESEGGGGCATYLRNLIVQPKAAVDFGSIAAASPATNLVIAFFRSWTVTLGASVLSSIRPW